MQEIFENKFTEQIKLTHELLVPEISNYLLYHEREIKETAKNIITYSAILVTFLIALWLSFQSEGPSKMPKVVTDEFTFTAWVNDGEDYLKKNYNFLQLLILNS